MEYIEDIKNKKVNEKKQETIKLKSVKISSAIIKH